VFFGVLSAFAGWLLLNGIFLWAGILVYILPQKICGKVFRGNEVKRAFLLAPFVYAPVCGAWFALCTLDWTASLDVFAFHTLAASPLGQITDLRIVAQFIRLPYFIALVYVLWNVIPLHKHNLNLLPSEADPIDCSTEAGEPELVATADSHTIKQFFFLMVGAGLMNAMLAGILLCRLPEIHSTTFSSLLVRSVLYVAIGILAGVGGSWLYWKNPSSLFREHPPIPFPLFALACASGWIWVPPMAIFSEQLSPIAAIVAVIGAVFLAVGLRIATFSVFTAEASDSDRYASEEMELFSESLYRAPREAHAYVITLLIYAGACALAIRLDFIAAALFALSAFLFVWKQTFVPSHDLDRNHEYRRAALRLAYVAIPAILVSAWALLDGAAHRNRAAEMNAALNTSNRTASGSTLRKTNSPSSTNGLNSYESLILWPYPEKKQIVSPLPENALMAPDTTQPLIIPFNGQYWYMQPPDKVPGPAAHQANGTPLGNEIASTNSMPLVMDAHQALGTAIPIVRCREIRVEIENRDNKMGVIALAVLLTDTASSKKPTLYLGQQPIVSTKPENFSYKSESVFETLHFSVPGTTKMRRFDEITVMMLPDVEHALIGPIIAIKQFQLLPR
jgi:hypothetical protein